MNETPTESKDPGTAGRFPDCFHSDDSLPRDVRKSGRLDRYRAYWASVYPAVIIEHPKGQKR